MESETHPIAAWHQIVESRDAARLNLLLSDDVVFYSPVVHAPQVGKRLAISYLNAALQVFLNDSFRYVRDIVGINDAMLEFLVEIDGVVVNGVDVITWNDGGKISEFKVMIRPYRAVNLIREKMAALLEHAFKGERFAGTPE